MKNKKGFVFVETIVVCSIIAVSLVTIYASFILLINNYKKRDKFNQAIYNYRLYNIAKAISNININECPYQVMKNKENSDPNLYSDQLNILYNKFNVTTLYRVKASEINSSSKIPINYNRLNEYIKTISSNDNSCLLIGEFHDNEQYYYSYVVLEKKA